MSTRCNVIIKNATERVQMYHHHDGYPDGVGQDLEEYFKELEKEEVAHTPAAIADYLCADERQDEYEREAETTHLHGDIEYLYVIDLDDDTINCRKVWLWDIEASDDDVIAGAIDGTKECQVEYVKHIEWK